MAIVELRRVQAEAEAERQRRLRESAEYQLTEQRKLNECMKAQHRVELARVVKLEHEKRDLAGRVAELETECEKLRQPAIDYTNRMAEAAANTFKIIDERDQLRARVAELENLTAGRDIKLLRALQQNSILEARITDLEQRNRAASAVLCDAAEREQMAMAELKRAYDALGGPCEIASVIGHLKDRISELEAERSGSDANKTSMRGYLHPGAVLGRLVRAMPKESMLSRDCAGGWLATNGRQTLHGAYNLPEDALRAAGIGNPGAQGPVSDVCMPKDGG